MRIIIAYDGRIDDVYGGGQVYVRSIVNEFANRNIDTVLLSCSNDIANSSNCIYHGISERVLPPMTDDDISKYIADIAPSIIHAHGNKAQLSRVAKCLHIPIIITAHHGGILCPAGALCNSKDEICSDKASVSNCLPCYLSGIRSGKYWYYLMRFLNQRSYINLGRWLRRHRFIPFITPIGSAAAAIDDKISQWNTIIDSAYIISPCTRLSITLKDNGVKCDRVMVVPHGIEPLLTSGQKQKNEKFTICFVGRLCRIKGLHVLLKAISLIKSDDIIVNIVGSAHNKSETRYVRSLKKRYKCDLRINWVGELSHDLTIDVINASDVMISPSICMETYGLNISEALSLGVPVIASKSGGADMQIIDGVNGWLIEPNDSYALAEKIHELYMNGHDLDCAEIKGSVVHISQHCDSLISIYQSILKK